MLFFTGLHIPAHAAKVPAAFISVHRIASRKSMFPVRRWVMDSGAFRTIELHGGYPEPVEEYANQIKRFAHCGKLLAAVTQDYMCEEFMLRKTGMTIVQHQRLTIERYDALRNCDTGGVYVMPVLQGYSPQSYVEHLKQYGARLTRRQWVGVGSVCKRNTDVKAIQEVLLAIKYYAPKLRLHGFGVKYTSLTSPKICNLLFSADSMAWSFAARKEGRDANSIDEAIKFTERIKTKRKENMQWLKPSKL